MAGQCIIVMGVSGCGKSTVGKALAEKLHYLFIEGDALHTQENIEKMHTGQPLTDEDRYGWLLFINKKAIEIIATGDSCVVACSALKKNYRNILRNNLSPITFLYLKGSFQQISKQLQSRNGHFMPASLLQSQFDVLEEPADSETDCHTIPITKNLGAELKEINSLLAQRNF